MNMNTLLISQLTAHLLADFNFQPQQWCDVKDCKIISKAHLQHSLVVFVCSWIFSFTLAFGWMALLIFLFHVVIDITKTYLSRKEIWEKHLFFIDQFLHLASIVFVVWLFCEWNGANYSMPVSTQQAFILFALVACAKPANIFIKKYMEMKGVISAKKEENTLMNAGRIIGSLERILSFCLIAFNQFAAVGFIIAAKSILRFRDKDTAKTEYVLIGSLLSFGIAILLGITYQCIIF